MKPIQFLNFLMKNRTLLIVIFGRNKLPTSLSTRYGSPELIECGFAAKNLNKAYSFSMLFLRKNHLIALYIFVGINYPPPWVQDTDR